MYATPDCQAATPLQLPVAVVVGEAALLVAVIEVVILVDEGVVAVVLLMDEEEVVGPCPAGDPAHALTAILPCGRIQSKRWMDVLGPQPFELPLLGTALVQ